MLLGCIGDDFTGSSDLANTLTKEGMKTTLFSGIPDGPAGSDVEAGVVALKTRTIAVEDAIAQSLAALEWLQAQGCQQFFFKYCSTFDSTEAGNIGQVAQALAEKLGETRVIVCPAFPATGRSVYLGHLFVNDKLLNESGMENHPLTPMHDADLRRCLAKQTDWTVDHISAQTVFEGEDAIRAALVGDTAMVVVDAVRDEDLYVIGKAAKERKLITGGSGIALGLPANFRESGTISASQNTWAGQKGSGVILSGSCSEMTRKQVEAHAKDHPAKKISPDDVMNASVNVDQLAKWVRSFGGDQLPLVYSSADPADIKLAQEKYGREILAEKIENLFGSLAVALVASGYSRIVVAGGETSGAVVEALDVDEMAIGPEIAAGVPAVAVPASNGNSGICLALKSGNFGQVDFFARAMKTLAGE